MCFLFSKGGGGIQHEFSEHVMANIGHGFLFSPFVVIVVIHKHNKLKQKRCQNGVSLRRIGGP